MATAVEPVGTLLRGWRERRRLSQLALATEAGISQRHLSFVESGRSAPSRGMILRLAEHLAVPLRARNALLAAGGFAPVYAERTLDDPDLDAARHVVERVLAGHEPCPALAVDRHWDLLAANGPAQALLGLVDAALWPPPVNVLRLSLHPAGLAPRIVNLGQWREHALARLGRQVEASADPVLAALREELAAYPHPDARDAGGVGEGCGRLAVPLRLDTGDGLLSFISTTTVFGAPLDVALAELAIESFFPADEATARALGARRGGGPEPI